MNANLKKKKEKLISKTKTTKYSCVFIQKNIPFLKTSLNTVFKD